MSRNENDFYPTPHSIINVILNNWKSPTKAVWEPCMGDGRFSQALSDRGHTVISTDITTGHDFFKFTEALAPTVVTNPPFKLIREFINHSFDIGVESLVLVCPERLWACKKGSEQFSKYKPSRFINLSWREDYLGKGGSPDRALAVSIWDNPINKSCSYEVWDKLN